MTIIVITENVTVHYAGAWDFKYSGFEDVQISQNTPSANLEASSFTVATDKRRSLLKATSAALANIPPGSTITAVELGLFCITASSSSTVSVYRDLQAWVDSQATWADYATGSPWNSAGSSTDGVDFVNTALATLQPVGTAYNVFSGAGLVAWMQAIIDGTAGNTGLLLKQTVETASKFHNFASSEYSTNFQRPELVITFTPGSGAAALAGDSADVVTATGSLSTAITISGDAFNTVTSTSSLLTSILINANASAISSATGSITTGISLTGASLNVATATGDLTAGGNGAISGDATSSSSADGELTTSIDLTGASVVLTSANGELTAQINLSGDALVEALATANIDTSIALLGDAQNIVLATASVTTSIDLSADALNVATATAGFDGQAAQLAGDASSVVMASASLTTSIDITGDVLIEALATGILTVQILLAGNAQSIASATGSFTDVISVQYPLAGINQSYPLAGQVQRRPLGI